MTSKASVHKTKEAISKKNNKQSNHIQSHKNKQTKKNHKKLKGKNETQKEKN